MEKTRSKFLLVVLSLVSPFSLLHYFSGILLIMSAFFTSGSYLSGVILIVLGLAISGEMVYLNLRDPKFYDSKTNKELTEHAKLTGVVALLLVAITVLSSLLYVYEIPRILEACSTLFLIGLPSGIIPILLFVSKDFDDELLSRKLHSMFVRFIPILIGEALITIFFTTFHFGFALNAMSLVLVHFVFYFIMNIPLFHNVNNTPEKLYIRENFKFDKLFLGILGFACFAGLFVTFLVTSSSLLKAAEVDYSFENVVIAVQSLEGFYDSLMVTMLVTLSSMSVFLTYADNAFKSQDKKDEIMRALAAMICITLTIIVSNIDIFSALFYVSHLRFSYLSLAVLFGIIPVIVSLVFEIIILREMRKGMRL